MSARFAVLGSILKTRPAMWLTASAAATALSIALPASASAAHEYQMSFGTPGAGAGQLSSPAAVAVDDETGDVYVADTGNHRVDEFTASGTFVMAFGANVGGAGIDTCTTTCAPGTAGSSPGEFESMAFIAVDNSAGPSHGDVYVGDNGNSVGDTGNSFITKFTANGALIKSWGKEGQIVEAPTDINIYNNNQPVPLHALGGITVESATGVLFVRVDIENYNYGQPEARTFKFAQDGTFEEAFPDHQGFGQSDIAVNEGDIYLTNANVAEDEYLGRSLNDDLVPGPVTGVAVDPSNDDLYVDRGTEIGRYGFAGNYVETFGAGDITAAKGIAVNATSGVYVADSTAGSIEFFPLAGPFAVADAPTNVTETSATLHGRVAPVTGGDITSCQFEYVAAAAYEPGAADPYSAGGTAPCSPAGPLASSTLVSANLSGLISGTIYHFRVRAIAANGTTNYSYDSSFLLGGPVIASLSASNVSSDAATLEALIDPDGLAATYHFEYLTEAEFQADGQSFSGPDRPVSVPIPEIGVGAGGESIPVSQLIQNLEVHTVYRYRVIAHNSQGTSESDSLTFTTQVGGGELMLADGRHWEMVSPPNKEGALIYPMGSGLFEALNVQASSNGNAIAFMTNAPTEANPQGDGQGVTVLGTRGPSEWSTQVIAAPHVEGAGISVGNGGEYRFFSEDLSLGLNVVFGYFDPLLSSEATEDTPYLRTNYESDDVTAHCAGSCYRPLVTAANVTPSGAKFGGEGPGGSCQREHCGPEFEGATPDLHHVVLNVASSGSVTAPAAGLVEWGEGKLKPVSLLPAGEGGGAVNGELRSNENRQWERAISNDGSRVIWGYGGHLYLRDMSTEETIRLDLPQSGTGESSRPELVTASSDLSKVFFLDNGPLIEGAEGRDLYEYNLDAPMGSRLTDLSLRPGSGESPEVGGVIGASEDGSYVYYSDALGKLTEYHDGQTTVIASGVEGDTNRELYQRTSRVSPNGVWLAFESPLDLTGYDTRDAVSGAPDDEVYLYNGETHKLVCASCNPTGARPAGRQVVDLAEVDASHAYVEVWVSALIPPWSRYELSESLYQSRYLSNSGRLFFDSNEALVPQDVNGTMDVYEYEPPSVGDCTLASVTFSERSAGCVGLISSGISAQESSFMDASQNGADVFFLTTARLQPQDVDSAYDLYDAHECSAEAPCYPAALVRPPECDTSESCKAAESPQPAIFGAPSSATFSGAGNITPAAEPAVASKPLTRAQKLVKALGVCRKEGKRKRAGCEASARKRYGAKKTKAKKANTRKASNDRRAKS